LDATKILFPESDERKVKEVVPLKAETKIPVRTSSIVQPVAQFDIHVRLNIKKLSSELFQNETISEKAFSLIQKHCDTAEKITFGQKTSLISYLLSCEAKATCYLVKRMPISTSEEITDEISPSELAETGEGTAKEIETSSPNASRVESSTRSEGKMRMNKHQFAVRGERKFSGHS
jgi:hypothetical protein